MNKILIALITGLFILSGCSNDDTSASKTQENTGSANPAADTQSNPLMGFKSALDEAKSVTSAASENEKKKQQALQDTY